MDLFYIIIALLLVLLNGFFVAAEFAMVKLRRTRVEAIRKVYGLRGAVLSKVHARLDAYLSACQLGITLASLGLGWIGEPAFARLLEPVFVTLGVESARAAHVIAFLVAFFIISYLHIVIGELAPKSMSIRRPETMSIWTAVPLYGFYWMMYPLIAVLNASSNWLLSKAGLDLVHEHEHSYSPDELKLILRSSHPPGRFRPAEWDMLAKVIEFSEMSIRDILKPASQLVALYPDQPFERNMYTIVSERFTRYPVIEKDSGAILGVFHIKDMIGRDIKDNDDILALLRPPLVVEERIPLVELLRQFRSGGRAQLAIVPETGGILGFVSFDDLLAAFLGEIQDEFHRKSHGWRPLENGAWRGNASLPKYTLERLLDLDIPSESAGSVGGLIMEKLQRLPGQGESIDFDGFTIRILSTRGPRILEVEVTPAAREATDEWSGA